MEVVKATNIAMDPLMPEHQTERKMREEPQEAVRFFTIGGGGFKIGTLM